MNEPQPFVSLNKETGLLDEIAEVRELALTISTLAMRLLLSPAAASVYTPQLIADLGAFLVMSDALMTPTTQYQLFRRLGLLFGMTHPQVEQFAERYRLSREYPTTHPQAQAAWEHVPTMQPDDPALLASPMLRYLYIEQQRRKREEEAAGGGDVVLPPRVEDFLKDVTKEGRTHDNSGEPT